MSKTGKTIILGLIACLMVFCAAFFQAVSGPAPENGMSGEELQRVAEHSSDQYNHLLQVWSKDPNYPSDTDANFPAFYGGAYMDGPELVIMVTSLDEETIGYFEALIDLEHVQFSLADRSFQELLHTQASINEWLASNPLDETAAHITGTGISMRENSVVVYTENPEPLPIPPEGILLAPSRIAF